MKEKVFKYSALALVLINFWTLYLFFDYFMERGDMFSGFGLLFNYFYSGLFGMGFGCLLLIFRLFLYLKKKANLLKTNFFYIFCGIFNLNVFIIWLICLALGLLNCDEWIFMIIMMCSFLISCGIAVDIYKSVFTEKQT